MLRAGRPETLVEAEVRELRAKLRDSQALAKAAEALVAGGGDLSRFRSSSPPPHARWTGRSNARRSQRDGRTPRRIALAPPGILATAAEQRIDLLEIKLQEIAAGVGAADGPELVEVQRQLDEARQRADEMAGRATEAESRLAVAGSLDGPAEELLQNLKIRVVAAEARAVEAKSRLRSFEEKRPQRAEAVSGSGSGSPRPVGSSRHRRPSRRRRSPI